MDAIYKFVKNFVEIKFDDIDKKAIEVAKSEVIDSLATALGGSSKEGIKELVEIVKEWGGKKESTIIAYGIKCPAPNAAQVNSSMIHALDYDDGNPRALNHIGCIAVSTCFATAEMVHNINGKEFLTAIALGADFMSRIGLASRPNSSLTSSGWHSTALNGFIASAAMASKIMRLNEEQTLNAIGIAYHQCAGNGQCVIDGAMTKRMGPGFASKGGITSALMAKRGITGAKNILEGTNGLFNLYHCGDYDVNTLLADLGKRFEGVNVAFKPYPCCGLTHPFIDATLLLKGKYNIDPEQIDKILLYGGQSAYELCEPREIKCAPRNTIDSQFSVPWVVATALVKNKVTLEDFTVDAIKRGDIIKTAQKITGMLEPSMSRHGVGPGRVKIIMKDGREYEEYVEHALGSIEKPMTFDDCTKKFIECANYSIKPLSTKKINKIIDMIRNLENVANVAEIMNLLN